MPANAHAAFRFVSWGDTKGGTSILKSLSAQVKALSVQPVFTIYTGDLQSDGFCKAGTLGCATPTIEDWTAALNGGTNNGTIYKTFIIRGNHDDHLAGSAGNWANYFNFLNTAATVGARNYTTLSTNLTYSFDYDNARFIGVDVPGDSKLITSAQIAFIDQRLTDAEQNHPEIIHAFVFFHGPMYYVANHTSSVAPAALLNMLNKHPVFTASFHGHEHLEAWVHMDSSRRSEITHPFEQFITGSAGVLQSAGCTASRNPDYCLVAYGFSAIDINGENMTVSFYKQGVTTPQWTRTFTKGSVSTPTPTVKPSGTPTSTPTITPTRIPTFTPTPTPSQNTGLYEAENAVLSGAVFSTSHPGYTGNGEVNYTAKSDGSVTWTNVTAPSAGNYILTFRYVLGAADRPLKLSVNNNIINSGLKFPSTGTWTNWSTLSYTAQLNAGVNNVQLTTIGYEGPDLDHLKQSQAVYATPTSTPITPTITLTPTTTPTSCMSNMGDANSDGYINLTDYNIWLSNYNTQTNNGPGGGDFNCSGKTNGIDYAIWLSNYGTTPTTPIPTILTPTPTTPTATSTPTSTPTVTPQPTSIPTLPPTSSGLKSFPGAEGFGANTLGGRGGRVIEVTNLNDTGTGSLRAAITASGPRTVVFKVAGIINLSSDLSIGNPYITIAGQSAPGGGITLKGGALIVKTNDVIIRHIRIRLGDMAADKDTVYLGGASNVIFDHVSASWSIDETFSAADSKDVSIQWSIISEPLNNAGHVDGEHGFCSLIRGNTNVSVHHNLYAHCKRRSPQLSDKGSNQPKVQVINNVMYDYFDSGTRVVAGNTYYSASVLRYYDIINNKYIIKDINPAEIYLASDMILSKLYIKGNIGPQRPNNTLDEWALVGNDSRYSRSQLEASAPFAPTGVTTYDADTSYEIVLNQAGATLPQRDVVDQRVVSEVRTKTGQIIDCVTGCTKSAPGGWPTIASGTPYTDSDYDGMADNWEVANFGNTSRGSASNSSSDYDNDGYTDLEEYLNNTDPNVKN